VTSSANPARWRLTAVGTIATILVAGGVFLAVTVDMAFLLLAALGTFGPGVLRELGLLRDQDEFQRQAARRAGYHAYLAGGFAAVFLVAVMRRGTASIEGPALAATLVLVVLWLAWFFSSVLDVWGAQRAASRTLIVFGSFWLMFVVLSNIKEPLGLLMESLVVVPFFLLAWLVRRWPRVGGLLLLGVAVGTSILFRFFKLENGSTDLLLTKAVTFTLFEMPLLASGLALLRVKPDEPDLDNVAPRHSLSPE
jgi:hypothetical protein